MYDKIKYFIDTEFIECPGLLMPISIGIVCEDGRELHLVSESFDADLADAWVKKNVIAKLPPKREWKDAETISKELRRFIDEPIIMNTDKETRLRPEFWAYYASRDWVCFCWLMQSRMVDMPHGWPSLCMDLKQSMIERGIPTAFLPEPDRAKEHDALEDARWLKSAYEAVFGNR